MEEDVRCPICGGKTNHLQFRKFAPFAKTRVEKENFTVEYVKCDNCSLIFCKDMLEWTPEKFSEYCYNDSYVQYDSDLGNPNGRRQNLSMDFIRNNIKDCVTTLDYGGGRGYLSDMMNRNGYKSVCYDPFTNNDKSLLEKKYDFVSCIEVLEHSYDVLNLTNTITELADKYVYLSTGLYDNVKDFNRWYYFNPRVGHILLFKKETVERLFDMFGFTIHKMSLMSGSQMNILLKRK